MSHSQSDTAASSAESVRQADCANFPPIFEFMDMDKDHVVFRRFKRLNLYNLLFQQRQLTSIDEKIAQMKFHEATDPAPEYAELAGILPKLEPMLRAYDEALLRQDQLMKLNKTPARLVRNFKTFSENTPEIGLELEPGGGWRDLVSLGCTQKHWLHRFLESRTPLQRAFEKPRSRKAQSEYVHFSEKKIQLAEKIIINLAFCILVIVPLFVLSYLTSVTVKLLVITAAFFVMAVLASFLSNNIENASLAVIAGYTAIFVVFLSTNPSS